MAMHTKFGQQVFDPNQIPLDTVSLNTSPIPTPSASTKATTPQTKDDLVQQLLYDRKTSQFAQTYGAFIKKQLDNIDIKGFATICDVLSIPNSQEDEGVLLAILTVVNATADHIRSTDSRPTLKQVADATLENIKRDKNSANLGTAVLLPENDLSVYHHAIFLSMGWLSMLYEPSGKITPGFFSLQDQGTTKAGLVRFQILLKQWLYRPLANALNGFGTPLASLSIREREAQNTLLHVSTVTCRTLCDMGNIIIEWSNVLCSHLEFDAAERKLTLFRLPSYCAMCLESAPHLRLFERYLFLALFDNYLARESR
ncbi:hypothetical protein V8C40DRAFT_260265 [Trichoderma camerunense]